MNKDWWKESVIYQIYPRSFKDSNADGIGDLCGIIQKLDYLVFLGVDVLWLSPIFQSPNDDNGYDVSDYCSIMEEFGTMKDFDELLSKAHEKGLKILLDLVPNHTSDEHRWFEESRKSIDNPYRDYYIWRKQPPSNWLSFFSGTAWELDEASNEYYLHLFSKKQPDLNWENPKVRQEIYNIMHFWLKKGVDGFRMDVVTFISKRLDFPNIDQDDFNQAIKEVYANGPRIHEFLQEMNEEVLSKYDIMTMGECIGVGPSRALDYIGSDRNELNTLYHFDHVNINYGPEGKYDPIPWKLTTFKKLFIEWDRAVQDKGWINLTLDNHDFPRMVSRFGNDKEYRLESAKLLATLLLTMRGGPCIYQGSEIGMTNVTYVTLDEYDDVEVVNLAKEWKKENKDIAKLLKAVQQQGRDNARTPMHWDDSKYAGFSEVQPWIKVNPNYKEINVEHALNDDSSIFFFYKHLIAFRKQFKTMIYGKLEDLQPNSEKLFVYKRWDEKDTFIIALNFSDTQVSLETSIHLKQFKLVVSNYLVEDEFLKPWEARIYRHYDSFNLSSTV